MKKIDNSVIDSLVNSLKTAVNAAGFENVVVGLSGGVDSALSAALAVRALGKEHVYAYFMPYKLSLPESGRDAELVSRHFGINLETIDISQMADAYGGRAHNNPYRLGNILARLRMLTLFDKSMEQNALVLGTENKTEMLLGYSTWFGDTACSINPLGDLYKAQVYEAAKLSGVPQPLLLKAPSADLIEGQTDEGDLGYTYAEIDRLLDFIIEGGKSPQDAINVGFDEEFVFNVLGRINKNSYKRALPVVLSIGQKVV